MKRPAQRLLHWTPRVLCILFAAFISIFAADVFGQMAEAHVNVDMIIQNVSEQGSTDISFTVPKNDVVRARQAGESVVAELGAREWSVDESIAKVSLVGAGMRTHPGIAARMFRALANARVNLGMISTSPIRISCVIDADKVNEAVRAWRITICWRFGTTSTKFA